VNRLLAKSEYIAPGRPKQQIKTADSKKLPGILDQNTKTNLWIKKVDLLILVS